MYIMLNALYMVPIAALFLCGLSFQMSFVSFRESDFCYYISRL